MYRIFYQPISKQVGVLFGIMEADLMMDCSLYRQTIVIKYSTITTIHSFIVKINTDIIHVNYYLLFFLIVIVIIITVILFLLCFYFQKRRQLKLQSQQHVEQLSAADEKVRRLLDAREQVRLDEVQKLRRLLEVCA